MNSTPRQSGFSMVEMAVTLAVLGILMAAAMPSMGTWMANARIRNTAESINEGLQKARTEAVRRNQPVTFWMVSGADPKNLGNDCALSASGGSWVVSLTDPTSLCATAPSDTTAPQIVASRAVGDGGSGVAVSAKQRDGATDATSVTFNAFGQVTGATPIGEVSVTSAAAGSDYRRYRVLVSSGGRTLMCDQDVADTTDPRHCP